MWIFGLFLLIPLVEIALFVTVGAWLTLWPTLAIVLFTGVLGAWLVRWQGLGVLRELQSTRDPRSPLAHGALILMGGFMLMLPGFFTDTLGFLLMVPVVRQGVIAYLGTRVSVSAMNMGGFRRDPAGDWVDADYEEVRPEAHESSRLDRPSKWTER